MSKKSFFSLIFDLTTKFGLGIIYGLALFVDSLEHVCYTPFLMVQTLAITVRTKFSYEGHYHQKGRRRVNCQSNPN